MLRFLDDTKIWPELKVLARKRRQRLWIAVAYIGRGGGKLLRLRRGDILVVDLTEENSRKGLVCPAELDQLRKRGVNVYRAPNLHAKVILCGRRAVISSANLSRHSSGHLDEAGLLTTDTVVVREVREWFGDRTLEEVTPELLRQCKRVYKPPRRGEGQHYRDIGRPPGRLLWLIGVCAADYPEDEVAFEKGGARRARRELTNARKYEVTVRWTGKDRLLSRIRKYDLVIQINNLGGSRRVEEAARFIRMSTRKSHTGASVSYLYLECARKPNERSWQEFKRDCISIGVNLPNFVGAREIRDPVKFRRVCRFASQK